jgi:serine/threonine protein kinase
VTPEQHHRIGDLYHRALALPAERRAAFLAEACGDDDVLGREVRSLLEAHDQAGDFIEAPAIETAATALAGAGHAALFTSMGHYEVRALLGRGGMGEVYRAHDQRLGRDVALKILPDHLALDAQHLARFEREARLLAALNHPNIAAL